MRISVFLLVLLGLHVKSWGEGFTIFEKDGRYGIKDRSGEVTVPAVYEMLGWSDRSSEVHDGVIGYEQNGRWGLLSANNKILTESKYYSLSPFKSGLIKASVKGKFSNLLFYGLLSTKGEISVSFNYSGLHLEEDLIIASTYDPSGTKYGGIDLSNRRVIPIDYKAVERWGKWYIATGFNDQLDIFNSDGLIISGIHDYYENQGRLVCVRNGYKGLIDSKRIIYDCKWKDVIGPTPIEFSKWEVLDSEKKLFDIECDSIQFREGLWQVYRNGIQQLQLVHDDRTILKELQLEDAADDKLVVSHRISSKWSLLNSDGASVITEQDSIFTCGSFYVAQHANQWDLYNGFGTRINRFPFDRITKGIGEYFLAKRNNYWGVIDFTGAPYLTFKYDSIVVTNEDYYLFNFLGKWGSMDKYGNWLNDPEYESIQILGGFMIGKKGLSYTYFFDNNLIRKSVMSPGSWLGSFLEIESDSGRFGLLDKYGELLIEPEYRSIERSGELFILEQDDYYQVVNSKGQIIEGAEFDEVGAYSEGLIPVRTGSRWGFIDHQGDFGISNRYEEVDLFSEGMAPVRLRGRWGFVDKAEVLKVQPFYDEVESFSNGLSIVKEGLNHGLIDKEGEELLEIKWALIERLSTGNYLVESHEGVVGITDSEGNFLVRPTYDSIVDTGQFIIVESNGKKGILEYNGNQKYKLTYSDIRYYDGYILMMN